jgi:hypothetical protein
VGIIPFTTPLPAAPIHGFYLYDNTLALVELFTAVLNITQPDELAAYTRVFTHLANAATYGPTARSLLTTLLDHQ